MTSKKAKYLLNFPGRHRLEEEMGNTHFSPNQQINYLPLKVLSPDLGQSNVFKLVRALFLRHCRVKVGDLE